MKNAKNKTISEDYTSTEIPDDEFDELNVKRTDLYKT